MRLGKRTARLVREAAVLGFVQGTRWGQVNPIYSHGEVRTRFPKDSAIVAEVLAASKSFSDLYPTLCRAEWPEQAPAPSSTEDTPAAPEPAQFTVEAAPPPAAAVMDLVARGELGYLAPSQDWVDDHGEPLPEDQQYWADYLQKAGLLPEFNEWFTPLSEVASPGTTGEPA